MIGIFAYIWLEFMVHVSNYAMHGSYGPKKHPQSFLNGNVLTLDRLEPQIMDPMEKWLVSIHLKLVVWDSR